MTMRLLTIMTVILLLNEICAQSCSICNSNRSIIKYPDAEALTDGTTCEQLEYQAHNFDESDHICASFYQVIGFATCGCTDKADDSYRESAILPRQSYCHLCASDGSIPDSDAIYDTDTLVTCGKVQDYLEGNIGQSDELCNVFQYRGVVNCGCSHSSISKPSCSLCKHEGKRVIDVHALAESDAVDTTCGVMEYILAVDVDNQYDANTCESLQNYFAPKCDCGQDFQMQNEDMVDAPAATASPSIIASSSPTNNPTHVSSNVPSSTSSLQPSYLPSEALSVQPSVMPSIKESSLPSSFPTRLPSIEPTTTSSSKPTLEASSSPTNSTSPSLFPSVHPTASNLPSFSPSSLLDRTANCTALKLGIMPHVQDIAEKLEIIINFYLWVEYEQELDISLDQLMEAFDRRISFIAAECTNMTPSRQLDALGSMKDIEEPVYFVQMNELSEVMDVGCSETAASVTVICLPISSKVTAFYSPLESQNGTLDSARTNVETFITRIIQQEFSSLAQSIPGIYNGTTVDEFGYHREQLSSGKKAAIGVGISCSVVALIAMGIVSRRGREMRTENMGIIPEGHIRSDDSISDNPTISSGRRAQMTGWEGSITDGSSSQYSRQMYSPRISDTSDGIISNRATSRQLRENSYLPGNVLRDLLGADDGDLSLGTREYDDDDMSFDHNDTIEL